MPAIDPVLATEALKNLHVPVLIVLAVIAVVAGVLRSRRQSPEDPERDHDGDA